MTDMIRKSDALALCDRYPYVEGVKTAVAALPAVTVGVKPLEWEEPCTHNNHVHIAKSIFGDYYIHIDGGQHSAWLEAHTKPYENAIGEVVGSVYAAQALAQADYEARILAALEPVAAPDPAAIREEALREAEKALRDWQDSLNAHRFPDTAITVGMSADVVLALVAKGAAE